MGFRGSRVQIPPSRCSSLATTSVARLESFSRRATIWVLRLLAVIGPVWLFRHLSQRGRFGDHSEQRFRVHLLIAFCSERRSRHPPAAATFWAGKLLSRGRPCSSIG